ncbi:bifunctional hydroxymethylpyrimidine kinase/phosphomethylpyrimidine kinase [Microbacterium saperdae]|uniref:Thiamine-phosphate synthase n=1 Tax=Microbacterium saperdae TaxID=69368 RepID=A0A543BKR4_9MICO|nr:bifunctional hydroxymethylpyrimidine kinase/phosphomethylpyrimidine kinase [Microbacterium saperdae]TQL85427.1 hydroxymethylpyrimidine kinase/phosphomethylpyrimidine kinase/thiamine-phosphate diphosphorylase [Microbacterium saperdae]GGM54254.1 thiamine biosynthesis multifunctional protein ThiED [Microbacterium saperdae]
MSADLSLYLVTDAALCGPRGVVDTVRQAVDGGVRIVQLREKHASDGEVVEQLLALSAAIDGRALLVVNDRLDAALEARRRGARVDGVHLGQGDASVLRARQELGPDALIGLTANAPEHLAAVRALPVGTVDYLGVGVIRPTLTKPDHPPALGIEGFREFVAESPLPCVAIGGVGIDDTEPLRAAGAVGIAVVSALCAADDPAAAARDFRRRWQMASVPRVLTIAGSDPSGGAGIQADLKSIAANGGYGMAAIAALTVQNTRGVSAIHVPPAAFLRQQLDALSDDIVVDAVKIGMLADAEVVRTVIGWLDAVHPPIVVVDPVMVATSGDRLLDTAAESALRALLERADVVTPNLAELAVLVGRNIADWSDALAAAEELSAQVGAAVLVKGGHLEGADAPDALIDAAAGIRQDYPGARIDTANTHGTGCSLSSAIATLLARGQDPVQAVSAARAWLRESLRAGGALDVGRGHGPIHHFAGLWTRGGLTTRPTAAEVAAEWWDDIRETRDEIDALPFIRALADGTLRQEPFVFYLAQDALYLREYARVLAEAARLAPTAAEQAFWAQSAHGSIVGELELHASWLTPAQGVTAATFSAVPAPATVAYLDHLRATAFDGRYPELIAAILPCFWLYTDLGERLRDGAFGTLPQDPEHPYASWLATYADPAFAEATAQAIVHVTEAAAGADDETRARMRRAFTLSSTHERAFFAAPGSTHAAT